MTDGDRMCSVAISYADLGWAVLPIWWVCDGHCGCRKPDCSSLGKHPWGRFAPNGLKDATKDGNEICSWFADGHTPNIGIRTGAESGILVIDIDPRHGGDKSLAALGTLPRTATVATGGGGQHFYFKMPAADIRSFSAEKTPKLGPGIDIRANGGYAVCPPSQHISGKEYRWTVDPRAGLADLPRSILDKLIEKPATKTSTVVENAIPEGQRDSTLTSLAGSMRRRGMSETEILAALRETNKRCVPPLPEKDIERIAKSIGKKRPAERGEPDADEPATLDVKCFADVEPRDPAFLWDNRFVEGAFNGLSGDPGGTKTRLLVYMASVISRGGRWPDCPDNPVKKGAVLFYSCEDEPGILRTQLDAHKADAAKVFVFNSVRAGDNRRDFDLNYHVAALDRFMDTVPDARAIFIDPVSQCCGHTNTNSNSEVRATLAPLADFAARRGVTIIGVNHHNKRQDLSYMYRGLGSMGFVAQARSVWAVIEDRDDPETRILAPIKANYSVRPTGLKYRIIDGIVTFLPDPWTGKLDDQLRAKDGKFRVDECAAWLKDRLKAGAALSSTLFDEGRDNHDFSRDLMYRAKERIGIRASKDGFGGPYFWRLPDE